MGSFCNVQWLSIDGFSVINRTNYPLSLVVAPLVQLQFQINYDLHCFDAATIIRGFP